eukprot:scaffold103461_cov45-Phaeocystis_antarctica.AAC.1
MVPSAASAAYWLSREVRGGGARIRSLSLRRMAACILEASAARGIHVARLAQLGARSCGLQPACSWR